MNPLAPAAAACRTRSSASGRAGSTLANGTMTSGFCTAASMISSFGMGAIPLRDSQSTVKSDGGELRSR